MRVSWNRFYTFEVTLIVFFLYIFTSGGSAPLRSLCLSYDKKHILVGTQTCEILEFSRRNNNNFCQAEVKSLTDNDLIMNSMVSGHFKNELWGLAVRPETYQDGYVSVYK